MRRMQLYVRKAKPTIHKMPKNIMVVPFSAGSDLNALAKLKILTFHKKLSFSCGMHYEKDCCKYDVFSRVSIR